MKQKLAALVTAVLALGALGACSKPATQVEPTALTKPTQTITTPDLDEYYNQDLAWKKCDGIFECAQLQVPLDYSNPGGEKAQIAMKRLVTNSAQRIGTLVMNPGGPGGSGLEHMTTEGVTGRFTEPSREYFDVLSFDPRGVGASQPTIHCRTDEELDADTSTRYDTTTPDGRQETLASIEKMGQECQQRSPEITKFASTDYTARDLDIMRAALGEDRLNFLGLSYGTFLGLIYADLFPQRVGRFILDGVLDPSYNINQVSATQARGFEKSINQFITECLRYHANDCPLQGDVDTAKQQLIDLLDSLKTSPMKTRDPQRPLTQGLGVTALIGPLYAQGYWWQQLMPALDAAINRADGTALLAIADDNNRRETNGKYESNINDANVVINMLDYVPVGTEQEWSDQAQELMAECPLFGRYFIYGSDGLSEWPVAGNPKAKRRVNPDIDGKILLIAETGDPATPIEMAQNTRKMVEKSRLLTVKSWNHTAYNAYANQCVRDIGDHYLLTGKIPDSYDNGICSLD